MATKLPVLLVILSSLQVVSCAQQPVTGQVSTDTSCPAIEATDHRLSVLLAVPLFRGSLSPALALAEELVHRGHNVTVCSTTTEDDNYVQRKTEELGARFESAGPDYMARYADYYSLVNDLTVDSGSESPRGAMQKFVVFAEYPRRIGKHLDNPSIKNYDVLIGTECMVPMEACLTKKWGIPVITLSSALQVQPQTAPPWPFPHPFIRSESGTAHTSDDLTFVERLRIAVRQPIVTFLYRHLLLSKGISDPDFDCPADLTDVDYLAGITAPQIVPTAIGFEFARPLSPLSHYVGPILSQRARQMPPEVKNWLDRKTDRSVVYVSMGSLLPLSREKGRAIAEGINSTGYSAVWSLRESNQYILDGLDLSEDRFLILDWAPQLGILQHKAVATAILHGGMNGVNEALYSGVPVVVLPLMSDQGEVAARIVDHGLGVQILPGELSGTSVAESIREIERGTCTCMWHVGIYCTDG